MRSAFALLGVPLALLACSAPRFESRPAEEHERVPRYQRVELPIGAPPGANAASGRVRARFVAPSGRVEEVDGFPKRDGFAVRFAPEELGDYHYEVRLGREVVRRGVLTSIASDDPGFIRRDPLDPHRLAFANGRPFVPLGENRINIYDPSWNYEQLDAPAYVAYMAQHGMNTLRVFIVSDCRVNGVLQPGRPGCLEPRVGQFDERVAAQFDAIFDAAEKNGVYVVLTAWAIRFTPGDAWKGWEGNPYAALNGGPAPSNRDFFTRAAARAAEQHRLDYLLARWGASSHLLAIDLLNEPEWDGAIPEPIWIPWANQMAHAWHTEDPYAHLVTAGSVGLHWNIGGDERAWYASPENDLVEWHLYGKVTYEPHALAEEITRKARETWSYGKPILLGEFAYGGEDQRTYDHTHVGIWSAVFSGIGVLAHSAPPFTLDSDEPMNPARAAHFAVLASYLHQLDLTRPLAPGHAPGSDLRAASWWLARDDYAALWLLAPLAGYGAPFQSRAITVPMLKRGLYRVTWIDDENGAVLRRDELRVDARQPALVPPPFTRHLAGVVSMEPEQLRTSSARAHSPHQSGRGASPDP